MLGYFGVWVSFGLLSPFLPAVGAVECSEKETVVFVKPSSMKKPTDCLIECSLMTYEKKLELQDNHNIRMLDSTEGKKVVSLNLANFYAKPNVFLTRAF